LRTQGVEESVADYVTALRTLMRRLTKEPTPTEQLRLLIRNLRPEVRLYIRDCDVHSLANLLAMRKQYEKVRWEGERFKPPPNIAQTLMPEVAYRPKKSGTVRKPGLLNSASHLNSTGKETPFERKYSSPLSSGNKARCWNCNKPGHLYLQCKQRKGVFCHACGRAETKGVEQKSTRYGCALSTAVGDSVPKEKGVSQKG
jgi:hypothetical protein